MGTFKRTHRRRHNKNRQAASPQDGTDTLQANSGSVSTSGESAIIENQSMFSPEQQKVIIEHLLITKNSAPHKHYNHVPCKFYRQGTCQAGQSCPFSHSLDAVAADQCPCEYFKKGNCKFGMKCVNAHVTSEGVDVKKPIGQPIGQPITPPEQLASSHMKGLSGGVVEQGDLEDVFEDEEYFLPTDFSDLLTPEELLRRRSRSSSTSTPLKTETMSAGSSLAGESIFHHHRSLSGNSSTSSSSSFTSPLLHQQLSFLQAAQSAQAPLKKNHYNSSYSARPMQHMTMMAGQSAWGVPSSTPSYPFFPVNDLTKFKIDEEDAPFLLDELAGGAIYRV